MSPPRPLNATLSDATVPTLPPAVTRPAYERRDLAVGVVHLGPGAFFRAHQAPVFEALAARGERRFGVLAAGLVSAAHSAALASQDGLFVLEIRDGAETARQVIGVVREAVSLAPREALAAGKAHDRLLRGLSAPTTHLVTLTLTEASYAPDPPTGAFSVGALLAEALDLRRARGLAPFTALSCDNLDDNGRRLAALVQAAAADRPALGDWIARHGAFPSTMVDRIAPAAREADRAAFTKQTGLIDAALTPTEPYWSWVIEDRFAGPRPELESVGVTVTADVTPFAQAKLRLLNAAHSLLAYLGLLLGHAFVHEAMADPALARAVQALWDEAETTLTPPAGLELSTYRAALLRRFANAGLPHRLDQIATDGSRKLPPRLLASLTARQDRPSPALALGAAAWLKALATPRRPFHDASTAAVARFAALRGPAQDRVQEARALGLLPDLTPAKLKEVAAALARLDAEGPQAAVRRALEHDAFSRSPRKR
ncbi:MAG: mannitol dehydrogenase family protein [Alphaproteobacteria bacterium]|nr:mannitol dehydrogenase family protein [Alphaproteobacteria bacterium]